MSAQAVLTVSAAVVLLTQIVKWTGLPARFSPVAVLVTSLLGVLFWGWSQPSVIRTEAFEYFAGWVTVAASAAGVFGFIREGAAGVTATNKLGTDGGSQ